MHIRSQYHLSCSQTHKPQDHRATRGLEPRTVHPIASCCTKYAIPAAHWPWILQQEANSFLHRSCGRTGKRAATLQSCHARTHAHHQRSPFASSALWAKAQLSLSTLWWHVGEVQAISSHCQSRHVRKWLASCSGCFNPGEKKRQYALERKLGGSKWRHGCLRGEKTVLHQPRTFSYNYVPHSPMSRQISSNLKTFITISR
jgi:hypothetical protein